ncbi:MAG TPA: hypothetical protein VHP32_06420 [Ignavibacteria bacterium]|nr:hypothetical protein [Ignavibacteria bacterium]
MNKITHITKQSHSSIGKKKSNPKKKRQYKHILDNDIQESLSEKISKRLDSLQIII